MVTGSDGEGWERGMEEEGQPQVCEKREGRKGLFAG